MVDYSCTQNTAAFVSRILKKGSRLTFTEDMPFAILILVQRVLSKYLRLFTVSVMSTCMDLA